MILRQLPVAMTLVLLAGCCHSHARPCPAPAPACCTPGGPLVPAAPVPAGPPPGAIATPPPGAVITPQPNFGR